MKEATPLSHLKEPKFTAVRSLPFKNPPTPKKRWAVSDMDRLTGFLGDRSIGPNDMPYFYTHPFETESFEERRNKQAAQKQYGIDDEGLKKLEAGGKLVARANGRGKFLLVDDLADHEVEELYVERGFCRDESPREALVRKKEELFTASWFQPEVSDFHAIDTLAACVNLPWGAIPYTLIKQGKNKKLHLGKGRLAPLLVKRKGQRRGVCSIAKIPQFLTSLGNLGKAMLKYGVEKDEQVLELLQARCDSGIQLVDVDAKRKHLNGAFLTRLELKCDVIFDKKDAIFIDLLGAMPFTCPRVKHVEKKTSNTDAEDRTINFHTNSPQTNSRGRIHIPRTGVVFYTVKAYRSPDKVVVRFEVRRTGQTTILALLNNACPLLSGKRKIAYPEDVLVPGAPTAMLNYVLRGIRERISVVTARKCYKSAEWYRTTKIELPENLTPDTMSDFSSRFVHIWAKEEKDAERRYKRGEIKNISKHLCLRRVHYLRKFVQLLKNRGIDVIDFLDKFELDSKDGYRNGYAGMRPAAEVAAENADLYPQYLAEQDLSRYRHTGNTEESPTDDNSTYSTITPTVNNPHPDQDARLPQDGVFHTAAAFKSTMKPIRTTIQRGEKGNREGPKARSASP